MKKLIILIITISIVNSCEPQPEDILVEYTIKNVSTQNVKLSFFNIYISDYIYKDTTFLIGINSEIAYHPPFGGIEDSVYIVFNNTRQTIYRRNDGNPRNIFNINNYDGGKVNDSYYKYTYTITDEDYNNAIEIK